MRDRVRRLFDNKIFYPYTWVNTKAMAVARAKMLRSRRRNVRVVKVADGYVIYIHDATK